MLAAYASAPGFALLMAGGHWLRLGDSAAWFTRAAWLGTLSYPCYILHMPVLHLIEYGVMPHLPHAVRTQPVLHLMVLVLPTVLVVSTLGVALEQGIMRWRSRVLKKLPASIPSATVLTPARVNHV
jgi:peptidoglycan/LPS O-acetylase OafA/YrhL